MPDPKPRKIARKTKATRAPLARSPLSREKVLRAALKMVAKEGVHALSMRKLASKLGVEAMSLYKYVENKDDLLDGLTALAVSQIEIPTGEHGWRHAMRVRANSARQVFLKHPWAPALVESRLRLIETRMVYLEAIVKVLRENGFSVANAHRAFWFMDSYLYGFLHQEIHASMADIDHENLEQNLVPRMRDRFPNVAAVVQHVSSVAKERGDAQAQEEHFQFGLEMTLDAVERLRE